MARHEEQRRNSRYLAQKNDSRVPQKPADLQLRLHNKHYRAQDDEGYALPQNA